MTAVALGQLLQRLAVTAGPAHAQAIAQLRERTDNRRLRVLVAGEAKRGKSTLINALLESELLPVGVVPVTAVATTIRIARAEDNNAGDAAPMRVVFLDGHAEHLPLSDLADLASEERNPANAAGVDTVTVTVRGGPLAGLPLELVDTPGIGSVHEHNTAAARAAFASLDAVMVVVGADPPITAAERDLLIDLARQAVATFVVLAKIDRLDPDERAQAQSFTEEVVAASDVDATIWPLSARSRDPGYQRFAAAFSDYLRRHGADAADQALRQHIRSLAEHVRDEIAVAARALELADSDGQARVREFADRLAGLTRQAGELGDRLEVAQRRLQRQLGEAAAQLIRELTAQTRRTVGGRLDALAADADADLIDEQGRVATAAEVRGGIEAWRVEQGHALEADLAEVVAGVERSRDDQLARLRRDARALLDVELSGTGGRVALASSRRFWFSFTDPPAWELPGAELLRRHGPGAARRARRRVLDAVAEVVDRHVGRARADLQQRLSETVRALAGQLRRDHRQLLETLAAALETATRAVAGDSAETDAARAVLADRLVAVSDILEALTVVPYDDDTGSAAMDPARPFRLNRPTAPTGPGLMAPLSREGRAR